MCFVTIFAILRYNFHLKKVKITQQAAKIPPKLQELVFITMDFIHGYSRLTLSGSSIYVGDYNFNCKKNDTD